MAAGGPDRRRREGGQGHGPRVQCLPQQEGNLYATLALRRQGSALGLTLFAGFDMAQESLERELATAAGCEALRLRLFQMQLFTGILVLALVVATCLVSTTLVRTGAAERRRREAL